MSFEPEEIEKRSFAMSLRGYDRDEVDTFMQEVATLLRDQQRLLQQAERAAAEAGKQKAAAVKEAVAAAVQDQPEPPAVVEEPSDPEAVFRQIGEETSKILIAARSAGDEILSTARADAAELMLNARREAKRVADESEKQRLEAERDLSYLREARALLATQLEDIQRRLAESVSRLRNPVEETALQRRQKVQEIPQPTTIREAQWAPEDMRPVETEDAPHHIASPQVPPEPEPDQGPDENVTALPEPQAGLAADETSSPGISGQGEGKLSGGEGDTAAVMPLEYGHGEEPADGAEVPSTSAGNGAGQARPALSTLLEEIRAEREAGRAQVEQALAGTNPEPEQPTVVVVPPEANAPVAQTDLHLASRDESLGDRPRTTARRIKRLIQEDQNELLDLLRTRKGRGTADENMPSQEEQLGRFRQALSESLGSAFEAGWSSAGGEGQGESSAAVEGLVRKQLLAPLRGEVRKAVEAGLEAGDTSSSIAERVGDIYRVWKGIRPQLLGEGMAYSAFHQGMVAAWKSRGVAQKHWVLSEDEMECKGDVCRTNEQAGPVGLDDPFSSGHMAPPAHGGCTCTIREWVMD